MRKSYILLISLIISLIIIPLILFNVSLEMLITYLVGFCYLVMIILLTFLIKFIMNEKEMSERIPYGLRKMLKYDLNKKEIWMVDYENCAYLPRRLKDQDSKNVVCYVFTNDKQNDRFKKELRQLSTSAFVEQITSSSTGKNLRDIEISLYVGIIVSYFKPTKIFIQSNDKGFESLIKACNDLGFNNIENFYPLTQNLVSDKKCYWIYHKIHKGCYTETLSYGNFKRKIKRSLLEINADEINYVIKKLQDDEYIEIKDVQGIKTVFFLKPSK